MDIPVNAWKVLGLGGGMAYPTTMVATEVQTCEASDEYRRAATG
jgi:hypothetical protein